MAKSQPDKNDISELWHWVALDTDFPLLRDNPSAFRFLWATIDGHLEQQRIEQGRPLHGSGYQLPDLPGPKDGDFLPWLKARYRKFGYGELTDTMHNRIYERVQQARFNERHGLKPKVHRKPVEAAEKDSDT